MLHAYHSFEFSNRIAEEAGFLEACEMHTRELADGLEVDHLPSADEDVMREVGSPNPAVELRSLVYRAKRMLEKVEQDSIDGHLHHRLRHAEQRVKETAAGFEQLAKQGHAEKRGPANVESTKKSRRWFKGLGQIGQGAALSIANAALAVGALKLPVSPETQTWGSIASVATGIGTVLSGIGELRNE